MIFKNESHYLLSNEYIYIVFFQFMTRIISYNLIFSDPEPITVLNATRITDTEITLEWDKPRGIFNDFEVQYLTSDSDFIQNITSNIFITLNNLKPYKNYTFTVVVRSGSESSILRKSLPISASFRTLESVPAQVEK